MDAVAFISTLVGQDVLVVRRVGRPCGGRLTTVEGDPINPELTVVAGDSVHTVPWDNVSVLRLLTPKDRVA